MITVVVPFRATGKTRLPADVRIELARAMLSDVLAAARGVGRVLVVGDPGPGEPGVETVADPGGGQGPAVAAALERVTGHALVVNADLPCATPAALARLAAAGPAHVAAVDGTTNALSLPDPAHFAPLYGSGSAARFAAHGLPGIDVPELAHDVDTLADLLGLELPLGPATAAVAARRRAAEAAVR